MVPTTLVRNLLLENWKLTGLWQVTNGTWFSYVLSVTALKHPVDHPDVLTESRPQELALLVESEPVDVEHFGHVTPGLLQVQPMLQVLPEVVAHERTHCHRVVHDDFSWKHQHVQVLSSCAKSTRNWNWTSREQNCWVSNKRTHLYLHRRLWLQIWVSHRLSHRASSQTLPWLAVPLPVCVHRTQ